jgi:hypothetical protein
MKRLLPILLLAGCSSGATGGGTSTLAPLPTTGAPTTVILPSENVQYTPQQFAFFDDVIYFYDGIPVLSEDTQLEYAELWCQLMEDGMGDTDVVERINEGGTDNEDRATHFAIVLAGIRNLCPSQSGKAEYIALNAPLP